MKRLWQDPVSQYESELYSLPECRHYPKPIQQPHPPIHFGGESDPALKRVADIGQGWYGFSINPEQTAERLRVLDRLLEERGRRRKEIEVSISPYLNPFDLDLVKGYGDVGVDQVILFVLGFTTDEMLKTLDMLANTILEPAKKL
jgi:hypothetical protein